MQKTEKQQVIDQLVSRLRASETLIVADYRGLSNKQLDQLRDELYKHGAKFSVAKNTLARRAAAAAGAEALLALLEGPTAIAFVESGGDAVAVAKALDAASRSTKILAIRGGVLQGKVIGEDAVKALAALPPADVLRAQAVGAMVAPLTGFLALVNAPLQNLIGLIDARIEQLQAQGDSTASRPAAPAPATAPGDEPAAGASAGGPAAAETPAGEPQAEAAPEAEAAADSNDTPSENTEEEA